MKKKAYCPSCGIDVEPFVLTGGGQEVTHCSICGLVLDDAGDQPAAMEPLRCVGIAEDSVTIRDAVSSVLKQQKIARDVFVAGNGAEFLGNATTRLKSGQPVSLAILDVEMPIMNGVQAALSLRELEKQHGGRKTPILFFTSRKCDDRFRQVLQRLQPSSYVNKGTSSDPADLARRVNKVLAILLQGKASV